MRFTHPVNTLKKLGCGLAFGATAIMAMPTSALACTQIYMGSKLTADGNTYYGRSEDFGPRYVKHFGIEPAHKDGNEYTSVESGFEYKSKGATYRYTFVRDNPSQWEDRYDAYSEAGINEKGVSCSATLSTSYNEKAEEADPITEETGIGEYSYASVILGESATAREGVELIGSLIDEQGVCSNDQIIIADSTETWLFAALSGHQWIAMKLADDIASLNPNIGNLTYNVDLDDTENCLHSEGIESMPKEKGFAEYTDGKFDVAKTAAAAVTTLWSYSPEDMDKLADRSQQYLAGGFAEEYRKFVDSIVASNKQAQVTNQTKVMGTAVESIGANEATAIVYTNSVATSPLTKGIPSLRYLSYRLTLKRAGSDWKVSQMSALTKLDLTPQL